MKLTIPATISVELEAKVNCRRCKGMVAIRLNPQGVLLLNCASCGYYEQDDRPVVRVKVKEAPSPT